MNVKGGSDSGGNSPGSGRSRELHEEKDNQEGPHETNEGKEQQSALAGGSLLDRMWELRKKADCELFEFELCLNVLCFVFRFIY